MSADQQSHAIAILFAILISAALASVTIWIFGGWSVVSNLAFGGSVIVIACIVPFVYAAYLLARVSVAKRAGTKFRVPLAVIVKASAEREIQRGGRIRS